MNTNWTIKLSYGTYLQYRKNKVLKYTTNPREAWTAESLAIAEEVARILFKEEKVIGLIITPAPLMLEEPEVLS